jgi:HSP20 family protein
MELWIENGLSGNQLWRKAAGGWFGESGSDFEDVAVPAADVIEHKDGYQFYFEVPGVSAESIEVSVEDDKLMIVAERKRPELPKDAEVHRSERRFGTIRRSFRLPEDADRESVEAAYRDGVLEVSVDKRPETKPVKVKVEYGN